MSSRLGDCDVSAVLKNMGGSRWPTALEIDASALHTLHVRSHSDVSPPCLHVTTPLYVLSSQLPEIQPGHQLVCTYVVRTNS